MLEIEFKPEELIGNIKKLQEIQIPRASEVALAKAAYAASQELKSQSRSIFQGNPKGPVPFTVNAFFPKIYKKPEKKGEYLEAMIFIRDEASGGNPPAKYLLPQIYGGKHYMTRFQGALLNTIVTNAYGEQTQVGQRGKMFVPNLRSKKIRLNAYGRMSQGQYTQILSALNGGISSADIYGSRRKADASPTGFSSYIYLDEESIYHPYFASRLTQNPRPGIYFVNRLKKGTQYFRVMTEIPIKGHKAKFNFIDIAEKAAVTKFNEVFSSMVLR